MRPTATTVQRIGFCKLIFWLSTTIRASRSVLVPDRATSASLSNSLRSVKCHLSSFVPKHRGINRWSVRKSSSIERPPMLRTFGPSSSSFSQVSSATMSTDGMTPEDACVEVSRQDFSHDTTDNQSRKEATRGNPGNAGSGATSKDGSRKHQRNVRKNGKVKSNKAAVANMTTKKRRNRPGFNSYLKVLLDEFTLDTLHQMSLEVQIKLDERQRLEELQQLHHQQEPELAKQQYQTPAVEDETQEKSSKIPPKRLKFKPRSRESLHMTLFFGGETICELPADELQEWHCRVSSRLSQSSFVLTGKHKNTDDDTSSMIKKEENATVAKDGSHDVGGDRRNDEDPFAFQVVGLKVFPPQRNNLVVAILEPVSSSWDTLHHDLRQIAKDKTLSHGLANISACSKDKWISHITLGNLVLTNGRRSGGGGGGYNVKKFVRQCESLMDDPRKSSINRGTKEDNGNKNILHNVFQSFSPPPSQPTISPLLKADDNDGAYDDARRSCKGGWEAYPRGIAMGGPIPHQVELDWNFRYLHSGGVVQS